MSQAMVGERARCRRGIHERRAGEGDAARAEHVREPPSRNEQGGEGEHIRRHRPLN
jgi:hypothetical protein